MNSEQWALLRAEFEAVEALPAAEREERLLKVAESSPTLAFSLRRLLIAADSAGRRILDVSIPERLAVLQPAMEGEPATHRELTGSVLKDRYRIESLLGSGGSSEVWLARDDQLAGRKVVVKVPHSMASGEGFQREVEALAGVHHSGVAHPLDSGRTDAGTLFLVLEWVDGRSLREILSREGHLNREVAMQVIGDVAEALDEVHRVGVLHLDVKPENVMVQETGRRWRAVLVDFGIARSLDRTGPNEGLQGSPRYMAPERFVGVESPASDVYALGVLALEMLSGQTGMAGVAKLRPKALGETLATALDSDPRVRPASAGELVSRLRRAIGVWRRQVAGIAVGLALVVSLLGYLEYQRRETREEQARQRRDSVTRSKEFAEAIGTLDSLSGAKQGRQFVGLWRFVDSESNDPEKLEAASEILIASGMQYGHPGHRHMGQSGTAETTLREAQRLADKAMALAPARWQGRKVAGQSRDALGSVLIEMGRYQEAEQVLLEGLRVSFGAPQLAGIHAGLLGSLSRIAFHNRDLQRCLSLRNQLVDVRRQLWSANQAGIGFWSDYAGALAARGYVFREMGDFVAALQDYGESDRILERGISLSPGNRQPAWQLARNSLEVGRTLCLAGDVQEACRRLAKASDELREFQRDDTSDQATLRELALSLAWLGKARKQAGFADKHWRSPVEEAVRLATEAAQHDPASAKAAENLEAIQSIAGDLRVARDSPATRSEMAGRP